VNESGFISAVNKKLPAEIYHWKVSDRFSAGVADAYYSSPKTDLWIEYKYYPKELPKKVKPNLSKLQLRWLADRHKEGRNIYVVVGSPTACIIYTDKAWETSKPNTDAITRNELIHWITSQLC